MSSCLCHNMRTNPEKMFLKLDFYFNSLLPIIAPLFNIHEYGNWHVQKSIVNLRRIKIH